MAKPTRDGLKPVEFDELKAWVKQCPLSLQVAMTPLLLRLELFFKLQSEFAESAMEALEQLKLDIRYLTFDLEATRRERDELSRDLRYLRDLQDEDN